MALNRSKKRQNDPTGQAPRRAKGTKAIDQRLNAAEKRVLPLVRAIPFERRSETKIQNAETVYYDYEITPQEEAVLYAEIRAIINEELETTGDRIPPFWFWLPIVEAAWRQGSHESTVRFNQLLSSAVRSGSVTDPFLIGPDGQPIAYSFNQISNSLLYRQSLDDMAVRNYNSIKNLSDRTAAQVNQWIADGLQAGTIRSELLDDVRGRFEVARSSAARISDTEVNRSFNDAEMVTDRVLSDQSGLEVGVLHISALLPTTRTTHAARHGNAYRIEDQLAWWNSGANRINCHCSTVSVLIENGKVVEKQDQEALKAEKQSDSN